MGKHKTDDDLKWYVYKKQPLAGRRSPWVAVPPGKEVPDARPWWTWQQAARYVELRSLRHLPVYLAEAQVLREAGLR